MATDTLTAVREPANSEPSLHDLATDIQIQARRIASLAQAIDEALDFPAINESQRLTLGHALNYVELIQEAAERARAGGEAAEIHAMKAGKVAQS